MAGPELPGPGPGPGGGREGGEEGARRAAASGGGRRADPSQLARRSYAASRPSRSAPPSPHASAASCAHRIHHTSTVGKPRSTQTRFNKTDTNIECTRTITIQIQ